MKPGLESILRGIAIGDAVGYPLEFMRDPTAKDFNASWSRKTLEVSDDTQMAMFLAEALINYTEAQTPILDTITRAYLHWYRTQAPKTLILDPSLGSLIEFKEMYASRAPGRTCTGSLSQLAHGGVRRKNDSKGNGTVMRCAPIAWFALGKATYPEDVAATLAWYDAGITHDHPWAAQSSAILATMGVFMLSGYSITAAVLQAITVVRDLFNVDPYVEKLILGSLSPKWQGGDLGGWVAEEALALAIHANVCHESFINVLRQATVFPGDSDTVGAIAGAIAGFGGLQGVDVCEFSLDVERPLSMLLSRCN